MAKLISVSKNSIPVCASALQQGSLVAFPTETVYGLGANALDPRAVDNIFAAKKRPKSDPLIVHVADLRDALPLVETNLFQSQCLEILAAKFWPGPLTIIVPSSHLVPKNVTGGSSFVGIRVPNHPCALELLKECGFPLAAPSANLFGHVSPTSAQHVMNDLGEWGDLYILDSDVPCTIGIESTIIKIVSENEIYLLRPGAISSFEIEEELRKHGAYVSIKVSRKKITEENLNEIESSGQLLRHYAPEVECFILKVSEGINDKIDKNILSQCVLIDFNSRHIDLKNTVLSYFDLSEEGLYHDASACVFSMLRTAEKVEGAKYIFLPDLSADDNNMASAIYDRIFRAASGKKYPKF